MCLSEIFERLVLQQAQLRCPQRKTGRPRELSDDVALRLIFKVVRTGMQWREVDCDVCHTTLLRRMHLWVRASVFESAYKKALRTYKRLNAATQYSIDSSYIKNEFGQRCVGRNHTDRGRKALKVSMIVDQHGVPYAACCHPGNIPDVSLLRDTLNSRLEKLEALPLYADKGYDSRKNRQICDDSGLKDRIFRRRTKTTRRTNAKRVVVEHSFTWLKSFRRLSRFYEHAETTYLGLLLLAFGHLVCSRFASDVGAGGHLRHQWTR